MREKIFFATFIVFLFTSTALYAGDPPHNASSDVGCSDCHGMTLLNSQSPFWTDNTDDAAYSALCLRCHTLGNVDPYNATNAPPVKSHESIKCTICHHNHSQDQIYSGKNNRGYFFLADGTATGVSYDSGSDITTITYSSLTATDSNSDWADDLSQLSEKTGEGRGTLLIPNYGSRKRWPLFIIVAIDDPDDNTIRVKGNVTAASKIAIIYGQLIRANVLYEPVHTTSRTVKLYDQEGFYSLAHNDEAVDIGSDSIMDDSTPNGMCQVCHTETNHWRNDGTKSENHYSGQYCIRCHPHTGNFLHGGGSGTGCDDCHGHDAGYDGKQGGAGTFETHSTHTENDDTHEFKGPNPVLDCADCHNINNFPDFADGVSYEDYKSGTMTTVCDNCHSPGGTYPQNNDLTDSDVGAMANWRDGIYESDGISLKPGKGKWCATCHDEEPANSKKDDSGVDAPNVIGDEDGSYTYGTGWGYYKTGHGLPATESYPASGGISAGVEAGCADCHDLSTVHIDGNARTFDDGESSSTDPSVYRTGYRLKLIDGEEPMVIPKTGRAEAANSRLCFNCHTDSSPYTSDSLGGTNFEDGVNRHYYHMNLNDGLRFKADWGGDDYASQAYTSRITCISCHNVHGSTRLAMIRDGKLVNREDGIELWYYNPAISVDMVPPQPEDLPLTASTGLTWMPSSAGKVCWACHGGTTRELFNRGDPYQDTTMAPVLEWTGETGFASDGVTPDSAASGTEFTFRVKYTDTNNDAPLVVELRIDADNNGSFESTYSMTGINDGDTTYVNGKIYSRTVTLSGNPGDIINYTYYAIEDKVSSPLEATGEPTETSSITLISPTGNNKPELNWVTDTCRVDGVSPAAEVNGSDFTFFVEYTDADDECPAAASDIQVIVNDVAYDLNEVNGADGKCDDGKEYSRTITLNTPGDLTYRFTATDGSDFATGEPTSNNIVTVIDATGDVLTVCPAGHAQAPCDHETIQAAVDALDGAHTVVVYPDTYEEKVFFANDTDNDTVVRSACGPEETIVDVSSFSTPKYGVQVQNSTGSVFNGFGITGGTTGVHLSVNPSFKYSSITLDNCNIYGNTNGGGVYITSDNGNSTITVNNSRIYSNSGVNGAGLNLNRGTSTINNSEIYNNTVTGSGGAAWLRGTFNIYNTVFRDNKADGSGGAIFVYGVVNMYQSSIINNIADFDDNGSGNGGGVSFTEGKSGVSLYLENSVLAGNQAVNGGGIWIDNGPFTAVNCTIADNQASGTGGAIHNNIPAQSYIKNSILWNNTASASGGHIASISSTTTMTISDSIINNDGGTTFDKYPYFVGDHAPTISGFISGADPFFEDAPNRDYHIKSYSPAIDNANDLDASGTDMDGNSRPQGDADDIGAYEYVADNTTPTLAWTEEGGYTADGANPDSGDVATDFIFRVDYTDDDDDSPALIQLWIDSDDNGSYDEDEKYDMSLAAGGDGNFTNSERYTRTINIGHAGDGELNYRFYATDGKDEATGSPVVNSTITLTNAIPSLAWTNESVSYASDGVNPDSGTGGTAFVFRVDYTDADKTPPQTIQVWVDADDSDTYEDTEKHDMSHVGGGDGDYANGERFTASLDVGHDGDGTLKYRFYAADAEDEATGDPTADKTIGPLTNNVPVLSWTGETNYAGDGAHPDTAVSSSGFTFRIDYTDEDNNAPDSMQVWVDLNDDGDYDDTVSGTPEKQDMGDVDSEDTNYRDGKRYAKILTLYYDGDGVLPYRFHANDGTADAVAGDPVTTGSTVTVTFSSNTAPSLDWSSTIASYDTDGVDPDKGGFIDPVYSVGTSFYFEVNYTDADDDVPSSIQVWVDKNDDGDYLDGGEQVNLTEVDGSDVDRTDGKLYGANFTIDDPGVSSDGILPYRFHANDGTTDASGAGPVTGATLTIVDPLIYPDDPAYSTIQDAIDAADNGDVIIVRDGEYFESINYRHSSTFDVRNVIVMSENGSGATALRGSGSNAAVVVFQHAGNDSGAVLEGFTIDNQAAVNTLTRGIQISSGSPRIRNCTVKGNNVTTSWVDGAGIFIQGATASIENCILGDDAANQNTCEKGCGLYAESLTGTLTISDTEISENLGNQGAGIFLYGNSSTETIIYDCTFDNNDSNQYGGAIHANNSKLTISRSTFTNNDTINTGMHGGALYISNTDADASATISNTDFSSNTATGQGGGIWIDSDATAPLTMTGCTMTGNTSTGSGGGLYLTGSANSTILTSVEITGNSADKGGGVYSVGSPFTFTNTTIDSNTASLDGGGFRVEGGTGTMNGGSVSGNTGNSGCGIYVNNGANLTVNNGTVNDNISTGNLGGGAYVTGSSTLSLNETLVQGNSTAQGGGGVYIVGGSTANLTNSIVSGNTVGSSTWENGGGFYNNGTLNLYNCTVAGNYAPNGGALHNNNVTGATTIINSILWGNVAPTSNPEIQGNATVDYSIVAGGHSGTGNLDSDPFFADLQAAAQGTPKSSGNYHICNGTDIPVAGCGGVSAAIDIASAGNAPPDDIDGDVRPEDIGGLGDGIDDYDMGADEYVAP